VIPANNKPFARLAAFRIIVDRLSKGVELQPRPLERAVAEAAEKLLGVTVAKRVHAA
jgi:AMP-polyphosphate phosphotransferase